RQPSTLSPPPRTRTSAESGSRPGASDLLRSRAGGEPRGKGDHLGAVPQPTVRWALLGRGVPICTGCCPPVQAAVETVEAGDYRIGGGRGRVGERPAERGIGRSGERTLADSALARRQLVQDAILTGAEPVSDTR